MRNKCSRGGIEFPDNKFIHGYSGFKSASSSNTYGFYELLDVVTTATAMSNTSGKYDHVFILDPSKIPYQKFHFTSADNTTLLGKATISVLNEGTITELSTQRKSQRASFDFEFDLSNITGLVLIMFSNAAGSSLNYYFSN